MMSAMKKLILMSGLLLSSVVQAQTTQEPNPPAGGGNNPHYVQYQQLVERAKNRNSDVDFVELIAAASDWELSEKTLINVPNRTEMVEAFEKKNYRRAVQLAELVLDYEFTNGGLHLATANSYKELGETERADFHRYISERILNALLSTGDGKTAETAYCVQGISEEYRIMRHLGYKVSSQAFIMGTGSNYDVLLGKDEKTKKEVGLYFDISGFFSGCVQRHREANK